MVDLNERIIGKKVKVIYDDLNRITSKQGVVQFIDSNFLVLRHDEIEEAISISKIIRIEIFCENGETK